MCQSIVEGIPVSQLLLSSPVFGNNTSYFPTPACTVDPHTEDIRSLSLPCLVRVPADLPA